MARMPQVTPTTALHPHSLAPSRGVDGQPRQQVVVYLGSIREAYIDKWERHRRAFWRCVDDRLDQLGPDDAVTRARIEARVAARVRRVTPENQAEFDAAQPPIKREMEAVTASVKGVALQARIRRFLTLLT